MSENQTALNKAQLELITSALNRGQMVTVGEFRGFATETINYIATKGPEAGKKASFSRSNYTIELGDGVEGFESVRVSVAIPDGVQPSDVVCPFKRGQRVLVVVESLQVKSGVKDVRASSVTSFGA